MQKNLQILGVFMFTMGIHGSVGRTDEPGKPTLKLDFFPVATQFSPTPSGPGWKGEEGPLSEEVLRDTVDNIRAHGFTGLQSDTGRPPEEQTFILNYAQSQGMIITHHAGALELFGRDAPPSICVYSPQYPKAVRQKVRQALAGLEDIPRLYNVFTYQDEPFHWGPQSFGYNDEVKAEFKKRYGYDLPGDLDSLRQDPKKWLDVLNFRSDYFPDGWRQVYRIIKEINPRIKTVLTHDSHNTFGAGYGSHAELALDDVFHWGGDFSDMFVFDLYPYMSMDFRFGEPAKLARPRISQTHYTFAQMRNLTRAYGKELGFWVGTYNPAWYKEFLGPELRAKYWSEREMSAAAVAQGADFLLTGYRLPVDAGHWESFGEGLRLIQKAGSRLLEAPKVKAKACMLFPRTQYLQLQEEYFNVGLSFELFLRAFGELDILHEEQVRDDSLDGYEILVLFDVKLLPQRVAQHIASFVRNGGIVIADCVPSIDAYRNPMTVMEDLFGVKDANTDRIRRLGHWVPYRAQAPTWVFRPPEAPDETVFPTGLLRGTVLGHELDLTLVSPRSCTVTSGEVLLATASGAPGVVHRKVGKGQTFLLGFCLQDTYFQTWFEENLEARAQLRGLIQTVIQTVGIRPHVYSSNPDIEASVRANTREGFLFVINHESAKADATIELADLDFDIGRILDLADGQPVTFQEKDGRVELEVKAPFGETRLLHLLGEDKSLKKISHFTLWQLPSQIDSIGMSYVMRTAGGKVLVIDGGWEKEAGYMRGFLAALGNSVQAWFITHPHVDHAGVLLDILKNPRDLKVETLYQTSLDPNWYHTVEEDAIAFSDSFYSAVRESGIQTVEVELGMNITVDGVACEVLGIRNPELIGNAYNDSCMVLRVSDASKSVLFLGDLGVEGGRKLLTGRYGSQLQADYVQMAHHGQNGVDEAVYKAIAPKHCLWPTPLWLWNNDSGQGPNSGSWTTMQTREWMDKLGVKDHYLSFNGVVKID